MSKLTMDEVLAFIEQYGGRVDNALAINVRTMQEAAMDATDAYRADSSQQVVTTQEPGTISIRPTASGWRSMAVQFSQEAQRAQEALDAWQLLHDKATGEKDEDV